MIKTFFKTISNIDWIYRLAVKIIANRIVHENARLTTEYLIQRGWTEEDGYYSEPNIKERDRVWIKFEGHFYRAYYGRYKNYISSETSLEWFNHFYLLAHADNGRNKLAGL
jgi:hypothetical protein